MEEPKNWWNNIIKSNEPKENMLHKNAKIRKAHDPDETQTEF